MAASLVIIALAFSGVLTQCSGLTITNATGATVKLKQTMSIKSEGDVQGIVQHVGTLGSSKPAMASDIARLKASMGVTGEGAVVDSSNAPVADSAAAEKSKVSVTRSEPAPAEAEESSSSSFFMWVLLSVAVSALFGTNQGQAVLEKAGLLKPKDAWSKMSVDGAGTVIDRFMESPLVQEAAAAFGAAVRGRESSPSKPQNVRMTACAVKANVSAVQWVKAPEPVDSFKAPKKREDFEGFPMEPPMSVAANQTFSALADMLDSAGESEIADKLRGGAAPAAPQSELNVMDDMGLTACDDEAADSPEVAALRAALAEDDEQAQPAEPEAPAAPAAPAPVFDIQTSLMDDEVPSAEPQQPPAPEFQVQKSLIDMDEESDAELI